MDGDFTPGGDGASLEYCAALQYAESVRVQLGGNAPVVIKPLTNNRGEPEVYVTGYVDTPGEAVLLNLVHSPSIENRAAAVVGMLMRATREVRAMRIGETP